MSVVDDDDVFDEACDVCGNLLADCICDELDDEEEEDFDDEEEEDFDEEDFDDEEDVEEEIENDDV